MDFIRWFKDITASDVSLVGGKNANLGEMYSKLTKKGIPVPNGFALTADAYRLFMKESKLDKKIKQFLLHLDVKNVRKLARAGARVRELILRAEFPEAIKKEIEEAYRELSGSNLPSRGGATGGVRPLRGKSTEPTGDATDSHPHRGGVDVAVRSSATAEDLPEASFAGQQESYLNVQGEKELLSACKKCIASLFTDRAISYREAKGFDHLGVALSVGVQRMVRSDLATSGVMFTLDTESGFKGVVLINASYGLGENIVKGRVTPDQFYVFKEGLKQGYNAIIDRRLGSKEVKLVYASESPKFKVQSLKSVVMGGTKQEKVKFSDRKRFCLSDEEIVQLAKWGMEIEKHYGRPMDIEWAKDGRTEKLYIVQARSETVKSRAGATMLETYILKKKGTVLLQGLSVGQKIGQGKIRIISSHSQMKQFKPGEVLVTRITDPDWEPIMRIAAAVVTEQGGKTSHAAIVSRELGIPCIVGANKARHILKPGKHVTVSCAEGEVGYIYQGRLPFEVDRMEIKNIEPTKTKILMNIGDPDRAFSLAHLPSDGVGLAREEFIFTNFIKIHPLALVHYQEIKNQEIKKSIDALTIGYKDKKQYLVDKLAQGIAFIATAFYPHEVIVRLSDFKTNEYATLIGGKEYEPKEENPMLGWRGASRYYSSEYKPAFKLECAAIKKVREIWGLKNVIVMVPFCRTVEEGKKVLETMKEFGLERGTNNLKVHVMCEIPSNVLLAKEFAEIFDGFSIGSNDLTQLTLGVDRDSALVSYIYNENNLAVKKLIREVITVAHTYKREVGICGQAPSDYPEFAEFLVQEGIDSISLNPDTVIKIRQRIAAMEKKIGKRVGVENFQLLQHVAGKTLTVMGLVGLVSVLGGYTCQTVNQQAVQEEMKQTIATEVLRAKQELRQEFLKKEAEDALRPREYTEDSFAHFTLQYPGMWQVSHSENGVNFSSGKKDGQHFAVGSGPTNNFIPILMQPGDRRTTTTWNGWEAERFELQPVESDGGIIILRLYPEGKKKSRMMFQFDGDSAHFDGLLNSIQDFTLKK